MITAPAAGMIELAADVLKAKTVPLFIAESQRKELREFGTERARSIGALGMTEDFIVGYELGIQTARMCLKTNLAAIENGVEI